VTGGPKALGLACTCGIVHLLPQRPRQRTASTLFLCCRACRELGLRRSIAVEVKGIHSDAGRQQLVMLLRQVSRQACMSPHVSAEL
jgi:hypothetical protein